MCRIILFSLVSSFLCSFATDDQESDLKELASKCASDINWIQDKGDNDKQDREPLLEEAVKKAKDKNRLVMWYVYRVDKTPFWKAAHLNRYMLTGPFADDDVVELINRKFVPLKIKAITAVGKKYDIIKKGFAFLEPGFVFINGKEELVHKMDRLRSISSDFILNTLHLVLEKNPACNEPSELTKKAQELVTKESDNIDALLALASEQIKDADYTKANETIDTVLKKGKEEQLGQAYYLKGIVNRREFKFDDALKALDESLKNLKTAELRANAFTEIGLVMMKKGKTKEAIDGFSNSLKESNEAPRAAEAEYHLGACHYISRDDKKAIEIWKGLADSKPKSRWAWKAAAGAYKHDDCFHGESALARCWEDPVCPPPEALKYLLTGSEWPRTAKESKDVAKRAVEFLLRHQRSDGSWSDSRYTFGQGPVILPNVWVAITALCSTSLLEWRDLDPEKIDKALGLAMDYMKENCDKARGKYETCYADSYRLMYFVKRASVFPKEKEKLVEEMDDIVQKLAKSQKSGYWAHEYPCSFATGTVLYNLLLAKDAGAKVPDETIAKAVKALEKCKSKDGTFPYMTSGPSSKKDAAGRMIICELALKKADKGSIEAVEKAVNAYVDIFKRWEKVRKTGYHADGQVGSFFFFYSFHPATECAKLLDGEKKTKALGALLEHLVSVPEIDGSFGEDPTMGKSFSTAMALLSLKTCILD